MTKKEFIKKMKAAMKETAKGSKGQEFTCNILSVIDENIKEDYEKVYGKLRIDWYKEEYYSIPIQFDVHEDSTEKERTDVRLNALAMYMAQSLEFGTYKDL